MLTSGVLAGFGDFICQTIENCKQYHFTFIDDSKSKKPYNVQRTRTMFMMGTFFIAPLLHLEFTYYLPYFVPNVSGMGLLKKLLIDQGTFAPFFILTFYPAINFVDGKPFNQSVQDLKDKYWATLQTNWKVWSCANLVNFYLMPIHYQVLFANFISMFFNAYLSHMHNSYQAKPENK